MLSCDKVLELGDSSLWKRFLFVSAYFMIVFNYCFYCASILELFYVTQTYGHKLLSCNRVLEDRDLTLRERFLLF